MANFNWPKQPEPQDPDPSVDRFDADAWIAANMPAPIHADPLADVEAIHADRPLDDDNTICAADCKEPPVGVSIVGTFSIIDGSDDSVTTE